MNFVCIVFELGDKMLTLSSMENLIVQCNHQPVMLCLTCYVQGIYRKKYHAIKESHQGGGGGAALWRRLHL